MPTHVTRVRPPSTSSTARIESFISLMWNLPPADSPMKPSATSLIQVRRPKAARGTRLSTNGPESAPKPRKRVIAGKPNGASRLPNVCAAMHATHSITKSPIICCAHSKMQSFAQHDSTPSSARQLCSGGTSVRYASRPVAWSFRWCVFSPRR